MPKMGEWLEADGLGGFACGTVNGVRTRRYHALVCLALTPPTSRHVLAPGFEAWVETAKGRYAITSARYAPGVTHPDGASRMESFERGPWPRWTYRLPDGTRLSQELFVPRGLPVTVMRFRREAGTGPASLVIRPFLTARAHHALQAETPAFDTRAEQPSASCVTWRPSPDCPALTSFANALYTHDPVWYRNFRLEEERARGFEHTEDALSPGVLRFDLGTEDAAWVLGEARAVAQLQTMDERATVSFARLAAAEGARRRLFAGPLERAADAYLVKRGEGCTLLAGYPWFTDYGRDTFISLRGLCLATGRFTEAKSILLEWSDALSEGMLPNRFPEEGRALQASPEYNSVDSSLWFVVVVGELLELVRSGLMGISAHEEQKLRRAVLAVLAAYTEGTRHGIRLADDGLLAAGEAGTQLTWMDARVDGIPVTPRVGKPVEVQALWAAALEVGARFDSFWDKLRERVVVTFNARFWNAETNALYDVIDVDHKAGAVDARFRPNQIFAIGGLPHMLLPADRARRVVQGVESRLWTPMGLRSLAVGEPSYRPRYEGGPAERDAAYHQGTVWPYLVGPFVEAWVRAHGDTPEARRGARARFLGPLLRHLEDEAGLGHVSEIADAEPPHVPRGCPFQAWSLAELLRLDRVVLGAR